jgi:hypothetical protein
MGNSMGVSTEPLVSVGDTFGRWTVRDVVTGVRGGVVRLTAECACGKFKEFDARSRSNLTSGRSPHCLGCSLRAKWARRQLDLGYAAIMPDPVIREVWLGRHGNIIARCENPRCAAYRNYGARGIRLDARLRDPCDFLRYATTLPC